MVPLLQVYGDVVPVVGAVRRQCCLRLSGDAVLWEVWREGEHVHTPGTHVFVSGMLSGVS